MQYKTTDGLGKTSTFVYSVNVQDEIPPQLEVNGKYADTMKVGGKVTIHSATASDNVDEEIQVKILVRKPDSSLVVVSAGDVYRFEEAGTYVIVYMALDGQYNMARSEFTIKVG